ncbi:unnamed protein product [Adineta ricciae]|uniref:Signal peptide peptidase-like 2B n=1 Tax=Adineta ricciae TaxID=249248 RepID=A0A816A9M9_ADIRI|nr:unnamed protein product [Adineta ricciae]
MVTLTILIFVLFSPLVISTSDDDINLLVRSSADSTVRRYCVELAKLPNGRTVNVTNFGWHIPFIASPAVNACNITDLDQSLPADLSPNTLLIVYEHKCKMTEHAWHVETKYNHTIPLMILTNRSNTHYELSYNTTEMPVSIPVLIFQQSDLNKINKTYKGLENIELSINYPPEIRNKFRPAVLLMFLLVFLILVSGNLWAADEFKRKVASRHSTSQSESTSVNIPQNSTDYQNFLSNANPEELATRALKKPTSSENKTPSNNEPAIIYMPYCIIAMILCFAIGWLLLIYYFPKVMIYVLQVMFCIGAFSSLTSCLDRLSYLAPVLRRYRIPSHSCHKPCTCQLGPLNLFTLFAMIFTLAIIIIWYVYRHADWAWILQDILGAAICITVTSVYRLGNMRVITLILLGFFFYDIFFVFITPYIPFFQPSHPTSTSTIAPTTTTGTPGNVSSTIHFVEGNRKVSRNPSVMEQVALGIGTDGEVVPLLFALPMFIPEAELDPCLIVRKSMLGFGDVILPGILLTFCKIFDIANDNRWPVYYIQSIVSYFVGLSLTHVALYLMNMAQPALLYLVPCILLSTILTGLIRGELRELYTGRRIQSLLDSNPNNTETSLLAASENSIAEQANQSTDVVVGISDAIGAASGVENR